MRQDEDGRLGNGHDRFKTKKQYTYLTYLYVSVDENHKGEPIPSIHVVKYQYNVVIILFFRYISFLLHNVKLQDPH